ncbi:unnamed protein product [Blumeria hordei]|uniref:Uncharacterized protein n=1 Tax=Blumeria hordei TaxID=2867405 RepID=A0A383V277_BLUHO|nr:unnamed protein product [Blumeria hordei]
MEVLPYHKNSRNLYSQRTSISMVFVSKRENLMPIAGISRPVVLRWNQIITISLTLLRTLSLTWKFHQLKITYDSKTSLSKIILQFPGLLL